MTPEERFVTPQRDDEPVLWIGSVNAPDSLNLRPSPDTSQPPLTLLSHATPLDVLDDRGDWLRVRVDGLIGYVYAAHVLRRLDPLPPDPITDGLQENKDAYAAPEDQRIQLDSAAGSTERLLAGVWNRFGAALLAEAQRLQIDPGLAAALLAVESNGAGFGVDGRLIIRFENHLFYHYWGEQHQAHYFTHFAFDNGERWRGHRWRPDPNGPWQECHLDNQAIEWQVFSFARQLDETAALLSISMGIAQIMGFNYAATGFDSVQSMFAAYRAGIANQIGGFFRFLENNRLVAPVRVGDYHAFARGYNGPGQADFYATKIQEYVATLAALRRPLAVAAPAPAWPTLPIPAAEETTEQRRGWLRIGAAILCLLIGIGAVLYWAGWRIVRRPAP